MSWAGFDGREYTRDQWAAHVAQMPTFPGACGITEHATGIPTLAESLTFKDEDYLKNTQRYYENSLGWQHGPHLFSTYRGICGFSALNVRGTHCSCDNFKFYGGECMGNRNTENYTSGPGLVALDNQHFAFACMFIRMGIKPTPATYVPHSHCARDGHFQCPHEQWESEFRESETAAIVTMMNTIGSLPHNPTAAVAATPIYKPDATAPVGSLAWIQAALNKAGASPQITVDGDYGPETSAAVRLFQATHHLSADGVPGPMTISALKFYGP